MIANSLFFFFVVWLCKVKTNLGGFVGKLGFDFRLPDVTSSDFWVTPSVGGEVGIFAMRSDLSIEWYMNVGTWWKNSQRRMRTG